MFLSVSVYAKSTKTYDLDFSAIISCKIIFLLAEKKSQFFKFSTCLDEIINMSTCTVFSDEELGGKVWYYIYDSMCYSTH